MPIINTEYFANLTNSVENCSSCEQLQELATQAFASIEDVQTSITSELATLTPMLALLTSPLTNPTAIVTWIKSYIDVVLTPMVKPTITYAAQLTALTSEIASLTYAINNAASKFPNCSITP